MTPISPLASAPTARPRDAASPEEAARQFESVLVRQFVEVMTKDLFDSEAEGMLTGQADLQRDTLTDTLTDHLVASGTFGIADLMVAQWKAAGRMEAGGPDVTPPLQNEATNGISPFRSLGAQGRPPFIDTPLDPRP